MVNDKLKLTNNESAWGIRQTFSGLDENKNYMLMAKSTKGALTIGIAWEGTLGSRKCSALE